MAIIIKPAETMDECAQISELEGEIWGGVTTTPSLLWSMAHAHGAVLLAVDEDKDDKTAGFCYSFVSYEATQTLFLYSGN